MWAVGALDLGDAFAPLVGRLGAELAARPPVQLKAPHVSLALWAMRKAQVDDAVPAFRALAPVVADRLPEFGPQALSTVAWSYADAYAGAPTASSAAAMEAFVLPLLDALEAHVAALDPAAFRAFAGIDFSHLAWAYASVRHPGGRILPALEAALIDHAGALNPQCVCNIAWAFAKLCRPSDALFASLAARAAQDLASYSDAELSVLVWAFAINRCYPGDLFAAAFARPWSRADVPADAKVRVFQAHLALSFDRPDHGLVLDSDSWEACTAAFLLNASSQSSSSASSSDLHMDVSRVLGEGGLGLRHANEHVTEEGFVLDVAVLAPDGGGGMVRLAIEVDGPSHFLHRTHGYTGSTLLKHRLLRRLGWTVLSVPYFDWNRLASDDAKHEYLSDAITRVL